MAGITHSAFRRMVLSLGGCGLVVTEMISATAFSAEALDSHRMLDYHADEHPIAAQIVGDDPQTMVRAATIIERRGFDLVDINAGCPAPSITRKGGGAALLRDLRRLAAILRAVRRSVTLPMTLKFRSGWDPNHIVAIDVARLAADCGCDALIVHPRTRSQRYSGRADWDLIRDVVEAVPIPVIASGDVHTATLAQQCLQATGAAGLAFARGAITNPWLLAQTAAVFSGRTVGPPTPTDRHRFLHRYSELLRQEISNERAALSKLKVFVGKTRTGLPGRAVFRQQVTQSKTLGEAWEKIDAYYSRFLTA
jgi:nifR3 family TIM-barrel protein